jgi:hypothetical protein
VDVYFGGVTTISIPTTFSGIEITLKKPSPNGYDPAVISLLDLKTNKEHFVEAWGVGVNENCCGNKSTIFMGLDEIREKFLRCLASYN